MLEKLLTETEKFLSSFHRGCVLYPSVAETKAFITNHIFRFFVVVCFVFKFCLIHFFAREGGGGVFFCCCCLFLFL